MEEKRYPTIEEVDDGEYQSSGIDMACESPATVAVETKPTDGITEVHDWIDDLDWDRFPSLGPFSEEETIARIEEAERDLNDPSKWISSEQMWERLYNRFPWLR